MSENTRPKAKRGAVTRENSKIVPVLLPKVLLPFLDRGVEKLDTDRSKFIRTAIREKLEREAISTETTAA